MRTSISPGKDRNGSLHLRIHHLLPHQFWTLHSRSPALWQQPGGRDPRSLLLTHVAVARGIPVSSTPSSNSRWSAQVPLFPSRARLSDATTVVASFQKVAEYVLGLS